MSVELPILPTLRDKHRDAVDAVSCWRGTCVDHYAQIETCMAKAVAAMIAHTNGSKTKRPTMFGACVAELKKAVVVGGPFCLEGADVRAALEEAEKVLSERNILVHATGRVLIDADGAWVWLHRYQPTGLNKPLLEGFMTKNKANTREKDLRRSRDNLKDRLKQFTDRLAKAKCAKDVTIPEPVTLP